MALVRTYVGAASDAGLAGYTTYSASLDCGTVTDGDLLIVAGTLTPRNNNTVGTPGDPTKSAGTSTLGSFTLVGTADGGGNYMPVTRVWWVEVTGSGTLTLDMPTSAHSAIGVSMQVVKYTGWDTSTPIGGTITQATAVTLANSTLSTAPRSFDETLQFVSYDTDVGTYSYTAPTGWSVIDSEIGGGSDYVFFGVGVREAATSTTVDWLDESASTYDGGGVALVIRAAPNVIATDDFNRANGGLGANWTTLASTPNILSNKFNSSSGSFSTAVAYWNADTPDADCWSEIYVQASNQHSGFLYHRLNTSTLNGYYAQFSQTSSELRIYKLSGGAPTLSATATGITGPAMMRFESVGNVHTVYWDGVEELTWTDSSSPHTAAASMGIGIALNAADTGQLDNWSMGDWTTAVSHPLTASGSTTTTGSAVVNVTRPLTASGSTTTTGSAAIKVRRTIIDDPINSSIDTPAGGYSTVALDNHADWETHTRTGSGVPTGDFHPDHSDGSLVVDMSNSGSYARSIHQTAMGDADHWAEVQVFVDSYGNSGNMYGPMVRMSDSQPANNSTLDGYTGVYLSTSFGGSVNYLQILRIDNGVETQIATTADIGSTYPQNVTHYLRLEAVGSTLTLYCDGVEVLSTTDSTYTSGLYTGVTSARVTGDTNSQPFFDNFSAGDWTASSGGPTSHSLTASGATTTTGSAVINVTRPVAAAGATTTTGTADIDALRPLAATGSTTTTGTAAIALKWDLVTTTFDDDRIDLTWNAQTGVYTYDIERDGTPVVFDHVGTTYSDTGLDPTTQYTYRVRGVAGSEPPFLASVDVANKRLLDQYGDPWFGVGDAAWSIVGQLSESDITVYMEAAAAKGINLIMFSAPEPYYTDNTPAYRNAAGYDPFTGASFQSSLNNNYWVTVDHTIAEAKRLGITCLICPQYIGYGADGWEGDLIDAYNDNPANLTAYGQAVAARYGSATNVCWLIGHDDDNLSATLKAIGKLVSDELPASHLQAPGGHHVFDDGIASWSGSGITFDFNTNYDYNDTPGADVTASYASGTTMYIEGKYEQEQLMGVGNVVLRWQMWEPLMAGACGSIMGNNPRWHFESGKGLHAYNGTWQDSFTNAAYNDSTVHLSHLAAFVAAHPDILTAAPDTTDTFKTSADTDYARFSTTIGVAYRSDSATLTLDTTELAGTGNVKIRRFDPTDGSYTTVAASEAQNSARNITYPGTNAAGGTDWVYIVELA